MDKRSIAHQLRRALELYVQTVTDESVMMEIPDMYPVWNGDSHSYKTGVILGYGVNADGETQLYSVLQDHVSQAEWTPDAAPSLYKKVGFTEDGISVWTQPLGASDAYAAGDRVSHKGEIWVSDVDGNVWEPGVYGWSKE